MAHPESRHAGSEGREPGTARPATVATPRAQGGFLPEVWPVVQRELRESARRPANRRLRLLSALIGTILIGFLTLAANRPIAEVGGQLLGAIHTLLLALIALVVAPLAADCIAREKREGTLGLLFLTPLTARGIVSGKALVQGLRDLTLWLAVMPMLTVPFLAGGVNWLDAFSALSLEFCATLLCLGAGLLVSSLVKERHLAIPLAFGLGLGFLLLFADVLTLTLMLAWRGTAFLKEGRWSSVVSPECWSLLTGLNGSTLIWHQFGRMSPMLAKFWIRLCAMAPLAAAAGFWMILRFAAARLRASWRVTQERAPGPAAATPAETRVRSAWSLPVRVRRCRDANPIAWLQHHSGKGWARKWSLGCGLLCPALSAVGAEPWVISFLAFLLSGFYLFVAVSGFIEEKRNGALELLLVTPVSPAAIIFGRALGLWQQFAPAALVVGATVLAPRWIEGMESDEALVASVGALSTACGFLTLPIFATYFALRVKSVLGGAALTLAATWLPNQFAWEAGMMFNDRPGAGAVLILLVANVVCVMLAAALLRHSLQRRIYAFS